MTEILRKNDRDKREDTWFRRIKKNHLLMMVLCCVVPLLILMGAVYFLNVSKNYLFWLVLLLCPIMHYFMMKEMHKDPQEGVPHRQENEPKKGGSCH